MKKNGFTLTELFIVTFIVIVILAIAVPNLLRSPTQSLESIAIGNLRTVAGAQHAFLHAEQGYAGTLEQLYKPTPTGVKDVNLPFLDIDLSGVVQGYEFTLIPSGESLTGTSGDTVYTHFICIATPHEYSRETRRSFYIDSTGVIRWEDDKIPTRNSEPI